MASCHRSKETTEPLFRSDSILRTKYLILEDIFPAFADKSDNLSRISITRFLEPFCTTYPLAVTETLFASPIIKEIILLRSSVEFMIHLLKIFVYIAFPFHVDTARPCKQRDDRQFHQARTAIGIDGKT